MESSPVKKPRTGASPARASDQPGPSLGSLPPNTGPMQPEGPTSPLFFSHSAAASKQISRFSGFHPSESSASLLARIRDDPSGLVTTLKLPRANVSSPSPARSGSTPGSWGSSMDTSAPALTPDARPLAPALQGLGSVDLIELVDQDIRPTFVVDLSNPANLSRPGLHILFYNLALRTSHTVLRMLTIDQDDTAAVTDFGAFKTWIVGSVKGPNGQELPLPPHKYGGLTWTCSTLRKRFRFVTGNSPVELVRSDSPIPITETPAVLGQQGENTSPEIPLTPEAPADPADPPDYFGDARRKSTQSDSVIEDVTAEEIPDASADWHHPDEFANELLQAQTAKPSFDWTRIPLSDSLPEHIRLARTTDWGATALGPIEDWPYELRAMANLVMGSPNPAALYWGPQFISLYNAAHIELAGQKHPGLMGRPYIEGWGEIWEEIEPVFRAACESGQATMKNDNHLFINRHGYLEETFFSWSIIPIVGADGEVAGLYNPAFENTRRKVTERQMLALREVGERTVLATTMKGFWPQVQRGLEYNAYDVPFALIYSVKDDAESEAGSFHSSGFHTPQLHLEGSIGAPEGHPCAIETLDLRTSEEGFAPYMRQSMASGGMVIVLSEEDGTMPRSLVEGLEWKGFGDPCRTIVVFPVMPTTVGETVVGFIIMGANPRRPYDEDYKLFIHLLSRQLATSMASVVLFEEEIKRGQRAARLAAMDRLELAKQLQLKSQEADESEFKFSRMAEFAPVGMFIANSEGLITFCNEMWWEISYLPRETLLSGNAWINYVQDEDRSHLESAWTKLMNQKVTISVEFRFICGERTGDPPMDTWVLMSAFPEKDPDGSLKGIFGCITDISSQKWAEKVQSERREEAVELKRQQENFIDITSHEMRNPLSAILQCADQIANSITAFASHHIREEVETLLESCLDAANTINLCASHQKRIVDDILTLSKLDSNLLSVTPIDEQPVRVIQRALKMFESELVANDIEFEFRVDKSFDEYGIKWARLDPSRLRQVLINLMTNAIKFTQTQERRNIVVRLAASKDISEVTREGIHYFARNNDNLIATADIDNHSEWGHGERINIHCSVEDSGPGLGDEELKILFQRFRQATPRTHVQYGGSGLGLFISRILTEMQGGQIGVRSEPGRGSQFSFYIQCRVCLDPPLEYEHISPFRIARKVQSPASALAPPSSQPRHAADPKGNPLYDVLIVEDNIVNQKVLQRQLQGFGNNTFVANHGKEALQTLQRSRFWAGKENEGMDISVILMDLEMPVMDGMTCARKIRELEKEGTIIQHIPIIAVTAYARPEQIANAKAAGIVSVTRFPSWRSQRS
jgi:PAS domain S-box-containing protein